MRRDPYGRIDKYKNEGKRNPVILFLESATKSANMRKKNINEHKQENHWDYHRFHSTTGDRL